jgi:hypothetical protein
VKTLPLGKVAEIERKGLDPASIEDGTSYVGLEHIDGSDGSISSQELRRVG